jgi:hypothetical protein
MISGNPKKSRFWPPKQERRNYTAYIKAIIQEHRENIHVGVFLLFLLIQYNNGVFKGIFVDNLQVGEAASFASL